MSALAAGVRAGRSEAIARAITLLERGDPAARDLMRALRGGAGGAHRVGVTGPPGAGKSTLLGALALRLAATGQRIGVLAIDPSSPFTQGAVLGDRVRMAELDRCDNIYIRSMATRGLRGGLGPHVADAADVLDAAGFDWVFVESVGVGQVELDIRSIVDSTTVVLVPESGDQVQAIKAGLMEIADLYVVNKCDREGGSAMVAAVLSSAALQHHPDPGWMPEVLGASAGGNGQGIDEVLARLQEHRAWLQLDGRLAARRRSGMRARIAGLAQRRAAERMRASVDGAALEAAAGRVLDGADSVEDIVQGWLAGWPPANGASA
jgi:LAO/AO transport system kinase